MILYKFRTIADGDNERLIDMTRFVAASHYAEALLLLDQNWRIMSFKRTDKPTHHFLGEITQETNGIFNECEIIQPTIPK